MKKTVLILMAALTALIFSSCKNINVDEEEKDKYVIENQKLYPNGMNCKMFIEINGKLCSEEGVLSPAGFVNPVNYNNIKHTSKEQFKKIVGEGPYSVSYPVYIIYPPEMNFKGGNSNPVIPWFRIEKEGGINYKENKMNVKCIKNYYTYNFQKLNPKEEKYYYEFPTYEAIVLYPDMTWITTKNAKESDSILSINVYYGYNVDGEERRGSIHFEKSIIKEMQNGGILPDIKEITFTDKYVSDENLQKIPEIIKG